jgi:hypothetical protein
MPRFARPRRRAGRDETANAPALRHLRRSATRSSPNLALSGNRTTANQYPSFTRRSYTICSTASQMVAASALSST